jgi:hemolysin activation/secretion protein
MPGTQPMRFRLLIAHLRATAGISLCGMSVTAQEPPVSALPQLRAGAENDAYAAEIGSIYVAEYRVRGAKLLSATEVGEAVYPYLGPARTEAHIEQARAALEKAYHAKGYQTISRSACPPSRVPVASSSWR